MQPFPSQLLGEPAIWYRRLCDLAAQVRRSLLALYNLEREKAGKGGRALSIPSTWDAAAQRWHWRDRLAAYDRAVLDARAAQLDAARCADIELLGQQSREDARAIRALTQAIVQQLAQRLKDLEAETIEPGQIAGLLRAVAAGLETAVNLEAAALGVSEVLAHLEALQKRGVHVGVLAV